MIVLAPETEQLVRQVAARTGRTPEDVLKGGLALEARIAGVDVADGRMAAKPVDLRRVAEIARLVTSRPLLDERTPSEILDEAWGGAG